VGFGSVVDDVVDFAEGVEGACGELSPKSWKTKLTLSESRN
jgi:hypothetical protein